MSTSNQILVYKNTVVTERLIEVIQAFLISEVEVERTLENGDLFELEDDQKKLKRGEESQGDFSFFHLYNQTVYDFKQLYHSWETGGAIDIGKVRSILLPLVELLDSNENEVFKLYHYSNQDDYLYHHSVSVALLSAFLAKKLGYQKGEINQISLTGVLCDCGMTKVNSTIVKKRFTLTEREYKEVKQHPVHSYQLLKNIPSLKEGVKLGVLQHHERIDKSGYPLGVSGDQLHPYSKIVALADTYQAMVTMRPYRIKQSPFKVLEQIMQDSFGKFDIKVVNKLKSGLLKFSTGTKVKLSNGHIAEIVFIDEQSPTRPMVKLLETEEIIILKNTREIFIEEII